MQSEAQNSELGLLPMRQAGQTTMALMAISQREPLPLVQPETFEAPPANPYLLNDADIRAFQEGTHFRLYEKLGAHPVTLGGVPGVQFAIWAPFAEAVSVIGEFNQWDSTRHPLRARENGGVWEGCV